MKKFQTAVKMIGLFVLAMSLVFVSQARAQGQVIISSMGATSGSFAWYPGVNSTDSDAYRISIGNQSTYVNTDGTGCSATLGCLLNNVSLAPGTLNLVLFRATDSGGATVAQTGLHPVMPLLNFDDGGPGVADDALMPTVYGWVTWGTSWRYTPAYGVNTTYGVYFDSSSGTSRTFSFVTPSVLVSLRFYRESGGAINYTVATNSAGSESTNGSCTSSCVVTTGFVENATTVTVTLTQGDVVGVDDVLFRPSPDFYSSNPVLTDALGWLVPE